MEKVVMVLVVMVVVFSVTSGGVVIEQAGEEAAKAAEESVGEIARRAIHKADKMLNGGSSCSVWSFSGLPCLIIFSLLAYFASNV